MAKKKAIDNNGEAAAIAVEEVIPDRLAGAVATEGESPAKAKTTRSRAAAPKPVTGLILPELDIGDIEIKVVGITPLIVHAWSFKAKKQMLDKQMKIASAGREEKNPVQDFMESLYPFVVPGEQVQFEVRGDTSLKERRPDGHPNVWIEGGHWGFPSLAFKGALVEACTSTSKAITKVQARQLGHFVGELVEIVGTPQMREDMVRLNGQTADIRHRAMFFPWSAELKIRYNRRLLTYQQIANLLNLAGFSVGIGEWRAEKNGSYGQFGCV